MANVSPSKMRTTVVLPRVLKAEVEAFAQKAGIPMGAVVRTALERLLNEHKSVEMETQ